VQDFAGARSAPLHSNWDRPNFFVFSESQPPLGFAPYQYGPDVPALQQQ
jgi:hypothetical protein